MHCAPLISTAPLPSTCLLLSQLLHRSHGKEGCGHRQRKHKEQKRSGSLFVRIQGVGLSYKPADESNHASAPKHLMAWLECNLPIATPVQRLWVLSAE